MVRNKAITLTNGDILLPVYDEREWSSTFMISEDRGRTWQRYGRLIVEEGQIIQPTVVQRSDGSLLAMMRRGGDKYRYAWQSVSTDNGRTWSEPRQTQFKNSSAALDMARLTNGHLVVVLNDVFDNREVLHVVLSKDEGITWEKEKVIEEKKGEEFSYPAVIQTSDGLIHITFTYNRKLIKHVALNEAWIEHD
jgi:predicted neuraminidase